MRHYKKNLCFYIVIKRLCITGLLYNAKIYILVVRFVATCLLTFDRSRRLLKTFETIEIVKCYGDRKGGKEVEMRGRKFTFDIIVN